MKITRLWLFNRQASILSFLGQREFWCPENLGYALLKVLKVSASGVPFFLLLSGGQPPLITSIHLQFWVMFPNNGLWFLQTKAEKMLVFIISPHGLAIRCLSVPWYSAGHAPPVYLWKLMINNETSMLLMQLCNNTTMRDACITWCRFLPRIQWPPATAVPGPLPSLPSGLAWRAEEVDLRSFYISELGQ